MAKYKYVVREGDVEFRKVNIAFPNTMPFEPIAGQSYLECDERVVLEIRRNDDTTFLYYESQPAEVPYMVTGLGFSLPSHVPTERVWLRKNDGAGVAYKVPRNLPVNNNLSTFEFAGDKRGLELFGDQYFEKVFTLKKNG